jgi:secondary thiamine-phosphate synthase enzyme
MSVRTIRVELTTQGNADVVDITPKVRAAIIESGLRDGIGCVFAPGATAGITTVEYEPGCVSDLKRVFDELAPEGRSYAHEARWHDGNGHSHVRAALLGPSLAFPFSDGEPRLGTWQQIVFVDFDNRSRKREILVQLVGE